MKSTRKHAYAGHRIPDILRTAHTLPAFQLLAPSCPKGRAELSPLCAGDSGIDRLSDGKDVVEFDATCIRPDVRFSEVGRSQERCSFPSRDVPELMLARSHLRRFARCSMATVSSARIQRKF